MKLKNVSAINETGNLKATVRTQLFEYVAEHKDTILSKAEKVENKNIYFVPVEDENGNIIYINFDVTVSLISPYKRTVKRKIPKYALEMEEDV